MFCKYDEEKEELRLDIEDPFFEEILITSWSSGLTIRTKKNGSWTDPLVPPEIFNSIDRTFRKQLLDQLSQMIPEEVFQLLIQFGFRFLPSLVIVNQSRKALELARSNKNLFWMIVCRALELELTWSRLKQLLRSSQTNLLANLFACDNRGAIRLLKKVQCDWFSESHYQLLKKAIKSDALIDSLKHQPKIPIQLIPTLLSYETVRRPSVISYWINKSLESGSSQFTEARNFHHDWNKCRLAGRVLRIDNIDQQLERCKTPEDLSVLLEKWNNKKILNNNYRKAEEQAEKQEEEFINQVFRRSRAFQVATAQQTVIARNQQIKVSQPRKKGEFPPPPFPGIDGLIEPIKTEQELLAHSNAQKNCAHSYVPRINKGKSYFYEHSKPRVTIELRLVKGRWKIHEMKLACNRRVPNHIRQNIKAWLDECVESELIGKYENSLEREGQIKF